MSDIIKDFLSCDIIDKAARSLPGVSFNVSTSETGKYRFTIIDTRMKKNEPKRDERGRFVSKKEEPAMGVFEFSVDGVDYYIAEGDSDAEIIKKLVFERDTFKEVAERFGGKYLDECRETGIYKRGYNKMRKIAKMWKKRTYDDLVIFQICLDGLREAVNYINWLEDKLPWYKRLIHRKYMNITKDHIEGTQIQVEGLDKE